eukprot:1806474-Amphidinium_carterae.1
MEIEARTILPDSKMPQAVEQNSRRAWVETRLSGTASPSVYCETDNGAKMFAMDGAQVRTSRTTSKQATCPIDVDAVE